MKKKTFKCTRCRGRHNRLAYFKCNKVCQNCYNRLKWENRKTWKPKRDIK